MSAQPDERDDVRAFLRERGCPDHVVEGGLEELVTLWGRIATEIENGYEHGFDDYRNDLDARQILAEAWSLASVAELAELAPRLVAADMRVRAASEAAELCLWGTRNEARRHYSPHKNWWYYRVPKQRSGEFAAELRRVR